MLFLAMSGTLVVQFKRIQKLFYDAQYSIPRMFQILNPSKFQYSPQFFNQVWTRKNKKSLKV